MTAATTFMEAFETNIRDRVSEDDWYARVDAVGRAPMTAQDVSAIRAALTGRSTQTSHVGFALAVLHENPASNVEFLREDLSLVRGDARVRLARAAMKTSLGRVGVDAVAAEVAAGLRSADVAFVLADAVGAGVMTTGGIAALRMHFDCDDWLLRWHAAETLAYAAGARTSKDSAGADAFVQFAGSPYATFRGLAEDAARALERESPFVVLTARLAPGTPSIAMGRFSESVVAAKAGSIVIDLDALAETRADERLQASYILAHQAVSRMEFHPPFPDAVRVFGTRIGRTLPFARALLDELSRHPLEPLRDAARETLGRLDGAG